MIQDLHDFLGLNEPFFNHSSDVVFTAQEGGIAYLSCEVLIPRLLYAIYFKNLFGLRQEDRGQAMKIFIIDFEAKNMKMICLRQKFKYEAESSGFQLEQ